VQSFFLNLLCSVKQLLLILTAALAMVLVAGCLKVSEPEMEFRNETRAAAKSDPRNTSYIIENTPVTLINGAAEIPIARDSSSKAMTRIWDPPTMVDLNNDGADDAVLILIHSTGGSGTFYYLVAAIASGEDYAGTTGLLLGDRIDPQSIEVGDGKVSVRYLIRKSDESFADKPSIEKVRDVVYSPESRRLVEVAHDFEGEADPGRMTLEMHTWTWIRTIYNNDTTKVPARKKTFTLTFKDGRVSGNTDCNSFNGAYTVEDKKIRFNEEMAMTRMFCEGSQEAEFVQMLLNVNSYFFTSRGQLVLELKYDSGSMIFL
jgi:heat shock protein HslJ